MTALEDGFGLFKQDLREIIVKIRNTIVIWTAILTITYIQFGCEKKGAHHGKQEGAHEKHAHHEHEAPHDGTLVELGEEFAHVEFVLEKVTGKLTGYVLDGEVEKPVRFAQKAVELKIDRLNFEQTLALQLIAVSNVLTGETEGDTSQFVGQSDELVGATEFHAEIRHLSKISVH